VIADIRGSSYAKVASALMRRWVREGVEVVLSTPVTLIPLREAGIGRLHYMVEGVSVPLVPEICRSGKVTRAAIRTAREVDCILYVGEPLLVSLPDTFTTLLTLREEAEVYGYFALNYYPLRSSRYAERLEACFDYVVPVTRYGGGIAARTLSRCRVLEPVPHGVDRSIFKPGAWMRGELGRTIKSRKGV